MTNNNTQPVNVQSDKQSGVGHIMFILVLVVAAVIGGAAYVVSNRQPAAQSASDQVVNQTGQSATSEAADISSESDIDKSLETLDDVDPETSSQSDSKELDSLSKDL